MSASLVGSEMCIRDRRLPFSDDDERRGQPGSQASELAERKATKPPPWSKPIVLRPRSLIRRGS
eukprot:4943768-Alexandrium_andersonii.AAC.1